MKNRVVFIGSKKLGLRILNELCNSYSKDVAAIITHDDSSDLRSVLKEYIHLAKKYNIEIKILKKPSELEKKIESLKPALGIVVGWYWIINDKTISLFDKGLVGLHGSLLPKYRGMAPFVWQIINGLKESGISLFYIESGVDTGDIIGQEKFIISNDEYIENVLEKAENSSIKLFLKYFPMLIANNAPRKSQNHSLASFCSKRNPEDGIIDWSDSNENIYNFVRAQSKPYPGAYFYLNKKKIIVWRARIFENKYYGLPGLVVQINEEGALVTCGEGALLLLSVEVENSITINPNTLLKFGHRLK